MTFKIERDIPIPRATKSPKHRKGYYPWKIMEPGDSVFLPGMPINKVSSLLVHHSRYNPPAKFTSRSMDGGTRVWRIE